MGQALSSCAPCSSTEAYEDVESYQPQWKEEIKTNCDKIVLAEEITADRMKNLMNLGTETWKFEEMAEAEAKALLEAEAVKEKARLEAEAAKAIAEAETKTAAEQQNLEPSVCYNHNNCRFQYYWF